MTALDWAVRSGLSDDMTLELHLNEETKTVMGGGGGGRQGVRGFRATETAHGKAQRSAPAGTVEERKDILTARAQLGKVAGDGRGAKGGGEAGTRRTL